MTIARIQHELDMNGARRKLGMKVDAAREGELKARLKVLQRQEQELRALVEESVRNPFRTDAV